MPQEQEPLLFTSQEIPGPWWVVNRHPYDYQNYYIYNVETRRYKRIGPVGAKKTNYFTVACATAAYRNEQVMRERGTYEAWKAAQERQQDLDDRFKRYMTYSDDRCPVCGSQDIKYDPALNDKRQQVNCFGCGASWVVRYRMDYVEFNGETYWK